MTRTAPLRTAVCALAGVLAVTQAVRPQQRPAAPAGAGEERLEQSLGFAVQLLARKIEEQMIFQALSRNGGNQVKAAQQLGISGRTLRRKMTKYKRDQEIAGGGSGLECKPRRTSRATWSRAMAARLRSRKSSALIRLRLARSTWQGS